MQDPEIIKKANLDYPIHPLLASRWSPRAFNSKAVETEKLQRIFEAARWSASSSNLQPWYFLVGFNGDEVFAKIFNTLVEFNQLWVINAPVLALGIVKTTNPKGAPNGYAGYDLGQAMAMLSLQAQHEGIYTHQMAGFDSDAAALAFEMPDDYKVMVAFTLGYRSDSMILHSSLQKLEESPRTRRPSSESVFTKEFGHKADFL